MIRDKTVVKTKQQNDNTMNNIVYHFAVVGGDGGCGDAIMKLLISMIVTMVKRVLSITNPLMAVTICCWNNFSSAIMFGFSVEKLM